MNRRGRLGSMLGRRREIWRMPLAAVGAGGAYVPDSRKGLMLDMRRREEAEGERRMMGSGRRDGFFGCVGSEGGMLGVVEAGRAEVLGVTMGAEGRVRVRPR